MVDKVLKSECQTNTRWTMSRSVAVQGTILLLAFNLFYREEIGVGRQAFVDSRFQQKKLTCCGFCVILLNQAVCRDNERFMRPFKSQQKYSCMMEKICVHCLQFIQINLEHTISCGQISREDLNISRLSWLQNWYTQVSSPVQSQEGKSVRQRATNRPYPSTERCAKSELGTFTAFP